MRCVKRDRGGLSFVSVDNTSKQIYCTASVPSQKTLLILKFDPESTFPFRFNHQRLIADLGNLVNQGAAALRPSKVLMLVLKFEVQNDRHPSLNGVILNFLRVT